MTDIKQAVELALGWRGDPTGDPDIVGPIVEALLLAHATIEKQALVVDAARIARRLSVELLSINADNERERYFAAHDAWIKATDATDTEIARLDNIQPSAIDAMADAEGGGAK